MIKKSVQKTFHLDNFEGPLDLLLHLVREKKLDLLEISLAQIADQFIEYVNKEKQINLDLASEYLLIASQLINIKSKYMLKTEFFIEIDEFEESNEENLIERLVKYEKYKKLSASLLKLYEEAPGYEKLEDEFISYMEGEGERDINILTQGIEEFKESWNNIYKRLQLKGPTETKITFRKISPEQRKKEIEQILNKGDTTFLSIVDTPSNYYISITLLVLLEMSANGILHLVQSQDFSDIEIRLKK